MVYECKVEFGIGVQATTRHNFLVAIRVEAVTQNFTQPECHFQQPQPTLDHDLDLDHIYRGIFYSINWNTYTSYMPEIPLYGEITQSESRGKCFEMAWSCGKDGRDQSIEKGMFVRV